MGDLYVMEANSMALIPEKTSILPQVNKAGRMCPPGLYEAFSPSLGNDKGVTHPTAESIQVQKPSIPYPFTNDDERGAVWGTSFSVASYSSRSSSYINTYLTQEMVDEEHQQKISGKKQKLKT